MVTQANTNNQNNLSQLMDDDISDNFSINNQSEKNKPSLLKFESDITFKKLKSVTPNQSPKKSLTEEEMLNQMDNKSNESSDRAQAFINTPKVQNLICQIVALKS